MNYSEAKIEFERLFNHELSDQQMREFLLSLKLDSSTSVESIAAAASVMRSHSIALNVAKELKPKLIDVVGTGGDKSGSFNISSTTSILLASCGCYVAKHGNRSITSKSGSADVLEKIGVRLDLSLESSAKLLEETGFTFMFAQNHHPAMKFIMPIRKSIDEKTVFNVLGPLTNPAGVEKFLLGVFDKVFVPKIAEALVLNGVKDSIVVSSRDGMDEISINDITYSSSIKDGVITHSEIEPLNFGIKRAPFEAILGGDALVNAKILTNVLEAKGEDAQRDVVLINAATALVVDGMARDIQDGLEIAREAILSSKAKAKLAQIIKVSASLS
ncbi:MAG: anthranilate phosphoribosyltransferase [Helicobacteraceae bacterium]|nr:anthranilate phosphoribosyltransferase [Helicobacteraceae bacterium]